MAERWTAPFQYWGEERPGMVTAEEWAQARTLPPHIPVYQVTGGWLPAFPEWRCSCGARTAFPAQRCWQCGRTAAEARDHAIHQAVQRFNSGRSRPARWRRWVYAGLRVTLDRCPSGPWGVYDDILQRLMYRVAGRYY